MKIVLLIDSLHSIAAGSERQIYKLAEGLVSAGHQLTLTLLRPTEFSQALVNFPCPIECLNITSIRSLDAVKKMWAYRKKISTEGVDVVHAYFPDACLLAPLWLKQKGIKIMTSRRDMGLIYQGKPAVLFRLLQPRTDVVISNSSAVASHTSRLEHIPAIKSCVIYNGLENFIAPAEATPTLFTQSDSIKFILVANIKPVKRILDAVTAIGLLRTQGFNLELALVGEHQDPEYCATVNSYIDDKGLRDCIYLTGSFKEPRRLLLHAHVGLLVSDSEGLSNTIMEYMQMGLPVIATAVGGNPELVIDGVTGLLVPKGEPELLADAMKKLILSPDLGQKFGQEGRAAIEQQFSIDAMIKKHEALYQSAP